MATKATKAHAATGSNRLTDIERAGPEVGLHHPEVATITESLKSGYRDDTVILFIPSHDRSDPPKQVVDQDMWANEALDLFGRLYRGATAFRQLTGIWNDGI